MRYPTCASTWCNGVPLCTCVCVPYIKVGWRARRLPKHELFMSFTRTFSTEATAMTSTTHPELYTDTLQVDAEETSCHGMISWR